jgi:hypothetical protein
MKAVQNNGVDYFLAHTHIESPEAQTRQGGLWTMARLTKHQEGQIVEEFYGIDRTNFTVKSVSLTRGGQMYMMGPDATMKTHYPLKGRPPKGEVTIVFGLTDVVSVHSQMHDSDYAKRVRQELQAKADELKAAKGAP